MKKAYITIKPSRKGELHKELGIAPGHPVPVSMLQTAKASPNPKVRKQATFALNAMNFKHVG